MIIKDTEEIIVSIELNFDLNIFLVMIEVIIFFFKYIQHMKKNVKLII
jgi:hypothetical protein